MDRGPNGLQSLGSERVRHDCAIEQLILSLSSSLSKRHMQVVLTPKDLPQDSHVPFSHMHRTCSCKTRKDTLKGYF